MVKNSSSVSECLNCGGKISSKYCPYCGQEKDTKRFEFKTIFHQIIYGIFNWENFFFRTFNPLLTRPGYFIKDYIKGKRKPYIKPFSLFLFFLTINVLVFHWNSERFIALIMSSISNIASDVEFTSIENIRHLVEANLNNQYFLLPFIFAFSLKLLLRKRTGINYAESLVFSLYSIAMFLFLDILIMFLSIINTKIWLLSFMVSYIYLSFAVMQFSGCSKVKGFTIGGMVLFLSYIIFMVIVFILMTGNKLLFGVAKIFPF